MTSPVLEADYLVIGAGASAMAFVDTLLDESQATVVMVDRRHRPGGHWNDAYPFVRLHQPSALYGVNSRELGSGAKDALGLNQGLYELASGVEVVDYFEQVLCQKFLPSGRVTFLPMSSYEAGPEREHRVTSLVSGQRRVVRARRIVHATGHEGASMPATHPPRYRVASGVRLVPVSQLTKLASAPTGYVVVGSGKTGIDACLWLLANGAAPASIRWIMPRDAWYLDRAKLQPGLDFLQTYLANLAGQLECLGAAASIPDLFARLEQQGLLLRLDSAIEPTMFRCATVTRAELEQLRRIEGIVRLGRVESLEPTRIVLERGAVASDPGWLFVDCSADGLGPTPAGPVFQGDTIRLLPIGWCQPSLSAAVIAYTECHVANADERNALCEVVPYPQVPTDWLRLWAGAAQNRQRWMAHEGLSAWLKRARLDTRRHFHQVKPTETSKLAALERYRASLRPALENLPRLLAALR
jgi:hypothetical protein